MRVLRRTHLRTLLLAGSAVVTLAGLAATVGALLVSGALLRDLRRGTEATLEKWARADRVREGVYAQISEARRHLEQPDAWGPQRFRRHGTQVYEEIRLHLFQALSREERVQVEKILELHERLEVAARPAFDLAWRGDRGAAWMRSEAMFRYAAALEDATSELTALGLKDHARLQEDLASTFRNVQAAIGLLALLLIGAFVGAALLLMWRLSPLAALAEATRRLGAGDLDVRVQVKAEDEIGEVARSFNEMVASVKRTQRDVDRRNRQLSRTVERLKRTQQELVEGEKMRAMGVMLAGLAHELNNPLASVLGYAELLRDELPALGDGRPLELARETADPLLAEARRARNLVRTLLEFSRKPAEGPEAVDVRPCIEAVVALRRYVLSQEGLRLDVDVPAELVVRADRVQLQQVVLNLVNNAFDALRAGGGTGVSIRARPESARWVRLVVEDDGVGVAEPDRVFDPFYTTKPVGAGTGLGLTLVRRFVTEWGGTITAGNRPQGGARFTIRLPRASRQGAVEGAGEPASASGTGAAGSAADAPGSPAPASAPCRVLVVEDEEPLLRLQLRLLSRLGLQVFTSSAAVDARDFLAREDVDLVISDVKMPGELDGLGLYRWAAEARPELAERFLFVSGNLHDPAVSELVAAAPDRFISKPFEVEEYLARIRAALA